MFAKEKRGERVLLSSRTLCSDRRIEYLQRAIESDPSPSIPELARMVNLSPSRLSHLFKLCTHTTLRAYLTSRRLEKAAELLVSSEAPVKEISYSVGYRHPASFTRAFQKSFACSPRDYRTSCLESRRVGCSR